MLSLNQRKFNIHMIQHSDFFCKVPDTDLRDIAECNIFK